MFNLEDLYPHDPRLETNQILAVLTKDVKMEDWEGISRTFINQRTVPAGSVVRVVMASRFGDYGITDDLSAVHNYNTRVQPDVLSNITLV